ncbi:MAG: AcrR family transcriptional regulator [Cellvibrionaceae bacterium]|jgi:AcrR family transcriptional regulator
MAYEMMNNLDLTIHHPIERSERRDAAENRQLLLATASRLFAVHGVEAICMSEIAKTAGVGKGTLYRRFSSKGELCLALLDCEMRQFQNTILKSFQEQIENGVSTIRRLNWFVEQSVAFTISHLSLMVEISQAGGENAVQDINQPHFWLEMTVKGHLQQMKANGEIMPETDLDYITTALLAPLDARIMKSHIDNRGYSEEQIVKGIQDLIAGLMTAIH